MDRLAFSIDQGLIASDTPESKTGAVFPPRTPRPKTLPQKLGSRRAPRSQVEEIVVKWEKMAGQASCDSDSSSQESGTALQGEAL